MKASVIIGLLDVNLEMEALLSIDFYLEDLKRFTVANQFTDHKGT
jgi:hypothetical protein